MNKVSLRLRGLWPVASAFGRGVRAVGVFILLSVVGIAVKQCVEVEVLPHLFP